MSILQLLEEKIIDNLKFDQKINIIEK